MEYFGGIDTQNAVGQLAVVDGNGRLVAQLKMTSPADLTEYMPAILDLRAVLIVDGGGRDDVVDWLLQAGTKIVPVSKTRVRLFNSQRPENCQNESRWLAHLCWFNPDIGGRLYECGSRSIAERREMRADSVTAWL